MNNVGRRTYGRLGSGGSGDNDRPGSRAAIGSVQEVMIDSDLAVVIGRDRAVATDSELLAAIYLVLQVIQ